MIRFCSLSHFYTLLEHLYIVHFTNNNEEKNFWVLFWPFNSFYRLRSRTLYKIESAVFPIVCEKICFVKRSSLCNIHQSQSTILKKLQINLTLKPNRTFYTYKNRFLLSLIVISINNIYTVTQNIFFWKFILLYIILEFNS